MARDEDRIVAGSTALRITALLVVLAAGLALAAAPAVGGTPGAADNATDRTVADAVETPDGGVLLVGSERVDGDRVGYAAKLDANGDTSWERTYTTSADAIDEFKSAVITDDGYVLVGSTTDVVEHSQAGWAVSVDADGQPQWADSYTGAAPWSKFTDGVATDDGVLLVGQTNATDVGPGGEGWAVELTSNGEVQWQKQYDNPSESPEAEAAFESVVETEDGYLLAGTASDSFAGDTGGWAVRVGDAGDTVWKRTYEEADRFTDAATAHDNGFVLVGDRGSGADTTGVAMNVGGDGAVGWEHTDAEAFTGVSTTDDGYLVTGRAANTTTNYYAGHAVTLDAAGTPTWQLTCGGAETNDWFETAVATGDGFLLVGNQWDADYTRSQNWLAHTDTSETSCDAATDGSQLTMTFDDADSESHAARLGVQ